MYLILYKPSIALFLENLVISSLLLFPASFPILTSLLFSNYIGLNSFFSLSFYKLAVPPWFKTWCLWNLPPFTKTLSFCKAEFKCYFCEVTLPKTKNIQVDDKCLTKVNETTFGRLACPRTTELINGISEIRILVSWIQISSSSHYRKIVQCLLLTHQMQICSLLPQ